MLSHVCRVMSFITHVIRTFGHIKLRHNNVNKKKEKKVEKKTLEKIKHYHCTTTATAYLLLTFLFFNNFTML